MFSLLVNRLAVGPAKPSLTGRSGDCCPFTPPYGLVKSAQETQGAPVLRVRLVQGLALSHRDRDVEALSLGSSSMVSLSGTNSSSHKGNWGSLLLLFAGDRDSEALSRGLLQVGTAAGLGRGLRHSPGGFSSKGSGVRGLLLTGGSPVVV